MNAATVEIIGYIGSALVLVSFLMASVVKLRVVNAVGSGIFAVYALIIHSYPTMIMNICLVLINLYYLWKLRNSEPNYRMLRLSPQDAQSRLSGVSRRRDRGRFAGNGAKRRIEYCSGLHDADLSGRIRWQISAGSSPGRGDLSSPI